MKKNLSDEIYERLKRRSSDATLNIDKVEIEHILNELSVYEAELLAQNKELVLSEKKLLESQEAYYNLFDKAPTPLMLVDESLNIIHSNKEAKRYFDIERKFLKTISFQKLIHQNDIETFVLWLLHQRYQNEPVVCQMVCTQKDAKYFLINARQDENCLLLFTLTNISEQKRLEQQYKDQKLEYETIFQYAQEGIAVTDLEGNFIQVNKAMIEITGYSVSELLRKNCDQLTALEDREKNKLAMKEALLEGVLKNFEKECIVKNDKRVRVSLSISLLPNKKTLLFMIKDITSMKLLEEQSKLASMGEMIGNIAHQWRQPLSIISTAASGAKMKSEYDMLSKEEVRQYSDLIVKQAEYLSSTIDNFRDFLKGDKNHSLITVKECLDYTLSLVDAAIKNNHIQLLLCIEDSLTIDGNINELAEAFINIINNGKDVLKEKVPESELRVMKIDAFLSPKKDKAIIEFQDNGGGIDEKIIDKIFEPYFSSKHKSLGTGLGLTMAEKIIRERHNGNIVALNKEFEYEQQWYKGACFRVSFPLKRF